MAKSNDTTDDKGPFYNPRSALLIEVACTAFLVMSVFASHAWRRHVWEERRAQIPGATVPQLLGWLDAKPNPVFKKNDWWRTRRSRAFGADRADNNRKSKGAVVEETQPVLDINHATEAEWKRLPGWGEVLSQRTVKFRKALGGFVSIEQLKLVYGLDAAVVDRNRAFLSVQVDGQTRMCLDTLSFRALVGHPLFDADATRRVLRARGRAMLSMDVFWQRLSPDSSERATWEPYLGRCEAE